MFRKIFKDPIPHKMERHAYDLANNMVGDILKLHPDKKVLLLGHDFGGAIVQYVATMQSMDAITFNSFRISIDIKNGIQPSRGKILMYAAVYPREEIVSGRRQSEVGFFPDPVSIKHSIPVTGSQVSAPTSLSFAALTMRNEREHLVRPTCLFVQPDPFYDETDRSILYQDFWAAAFSPALFSPTQIAEAVGSFAVFSSVASRMVEDLLWPTAGTTQFDLDVKANFQRALFDDAARKATLTSGFLGALHVISDVERRKYGKVAMTIASKSAVKRFINFYRRSLMAHSMECFVRGLHSTDKNAGMLNLLDSTIVVPPAECGKKLF